MCAEEMLSLVKAPILGWFALQHCEAKTTLLCPIYFNTGLRRVSLSPVLREHMNISSKHMPAKILNILS